jgi:2-polyprenyl-3-methyl-5-hydroxy-6-metoxy-1,4-benzoquinol methylase
MKHSQDEIRGEQAYDKMLKLADLVETKENKHYLELRSLYRARPRLMNLFRKLIRFHQGQKLRILDLGCGNGKFLFICSTFGFKELIGVDYFVTKENSYLANVEGGSISNYVDFNKRNFLDFVQDESIDCLVCMETFEHLLNHPLGFLLEGWKKLRAGGLLLFSVPNPANIANALTLISGKTYQWGTLKFAMVPKLGSDLQQLNPEWDIHFMEYSQHDMQAIFTQVPRAIVLDKGFVGANSCYLESPFKRFFKWQLKLLHLRNSRIFANTQYWVLRKQ